MAITFFPPLNFASGGAVGGATNLTTTNAIVTVASAGVVTQDGLTLLSGVFAPTADSTTAIRFAAANGTTILATADSTNNRWGFGVGTPLVAVHIFSGASGVTPTGSTILCVESSASAVVNILTPATGTGVIAWGRPGNAAVTQLTYSHVTNLLRTIVNGNVTLNQGALISGFNVAPVNFGLTVSGTGAPNLTLQVWDQTATTGATLLQVRAGAGQAASLQTWTDFATSAILSSVSATGIFSVAGLTTAAPVRFNGTNSTGAGTAVIGAANSPAITNTAVFTWISAVAADGSAVFIPCWK